MFTLFHIISHFGVLLRYKCDTFFIMVRFKPVIRSTQKRKDGTYNLKIEVSHNRVVGYLSTEYYVYGKEIENNGRINSLYRSSTDANDINLTMSEKIGSYSSRIKKLKDVEHYTMPMLLKYLREEGDPTDLFTILDRKIQLMDELDNGNYRDSFKNTKTLLKDHLGFNTIPLEIITKNWLEALEHKLKIIKKPDGTIGHSPNTIGVRMRNIRTCYNEGADLLPAHANPFKKYKIPREKTKKIDLTLEEIQAISTTVINEPLMRWCRDMYMLMLYLVGVNMRDLAFVDNIDEGRINYTRSKGKKQYSIKIFPEAQSIIDRNKGKKHLLNIMDQYSDYTTAAKRINYKLKDIAKLCGIKKLVTINSCRHSWVTIGFGLGISMDILSRGLGHIVLKETNAITKIYIHEYLSPVDDANERVIKAINQDEDGLITTLNT